MLYAIVCAAVPYKAENLDELLKVITSTIISFPCKLTPGTADAANAWIDVKTLIRRLLNIEPTKRPSLPEILANEWLCDGHVPAEGTGMDCEDCQNIAFDNGDIKTSINIANIFYARNGKKGKITMSDYYKICGDFVHKGLDEHVVEQVVALGYDREMLVRSLNADEINHATATYYLLQSSRLDNKQ